MTTLIGTFHGTFDMNGPARLEKLLSYLHPHAISIEVPEGIDIDGFVTTANERIRDTRRSIRECAAEPWLKQLAQKTVDTYVYELRVAHAQAKKMKAKLYAIDHPDLSEVESFLYVGDAASLMQEIIDSMSPELQKTAASMDIQEFMKLHGKGSRRLYHDPQLLEALYESLPALQKEKLKINFPVSGNTRESYMAERIRALQPNVHIGGAAHAFPEFAPICLPNGTVPLYDLIKDIVTTRYRLSDADDIVS